MKTILFMSPIFVPVILISAIFGLLGLTIGILISCFVCTLIILNPDRIVLRIYRANPLPEQLSEIKEIIGVLCDRGGIHVPSIYSTDLPLPGSFLIGRDKNCTALVIPNRILSLVNRDELEAMLAYNIVQINDSIRLKTLALLMSVILTQPASAIRWGAVFTGFGDYNDPAPKLIGLLVMGFVAPPAAIMMQSVTNRNYDADAAALCRDPEAFNSVIERLESNNVTAYPYLGSLCLVDPQKENFFEYLFNSHPTKELRINRNKTRIQQ